MRDVQNVPWGLVEPSQGDVHFELLDTAVQTAQAAGARYVGTVMPYAGWELRAAGYPPATDEMCRRLLDEDFFYLAYDQRMDRYRDEGAYLRFLTKVVERYDGDGIDDMPGLTAPVRYWQIHNEPEGDRCGLFRSDVAGFVRHMRISYEAVKSACSDCVVLNGGAGIPLFHETRNPVPAGVHFWRDYAALGGAPFIDVIAVHYNQGKDPGHGSVDDFEYQITRAREILGAGKPVWVTEFGVVIGDRGAFRGMTETSAAAWYMRMVAAGLAAGAVRFFPDAPSFVEMDGTVYLTFYVQKMLQAKLGGFTSAVKLAAGQYRFRTGSSDVYLLWSGVPSALTGTVTSYDMYGNETRTDAAMLRPSESSPLLVVAPAATGPRRRAAAR
ncbi:MAG TPA: glycosyl hydrolase [Thermoanaerobaculia bacterium]|nr:glycosyl hydrolase [Thermoanaerobaculia bacterium]